jgi:hypothetical protein
MRSKTFDEVEAYDTKAARWLKFASLPAPRHGSAAAVADDKLFFIAGSGRCGGGNMMPDTRAERSRREFKVSHGCCLRSAL